MLPDPLSRPVGALMRPVEILEAESSLERAAFELRVAQAPYLASVSGGALQGVVTEMSLGRALANGAQMSDPISVAYDAQVQTIDPHSSGAEALRRIVEGEQAALVVADHTGTVFGILSASDLYPKPARPIVPNLIGGMATPFGVYLTTGGLGAGAGHLALLATGSMMFGMYLIGTVAAHYAVRAMVGTGIEPFSQIVFDFLPLVVFLGALRFLPLSGTHAAEHKVVHAIERGEPLVPEVVKRMPRVHPRCGTNIAVGATLFLSIASWSIIREQEPRLLLAGLVTLFCWRPLGNLMQLLVTTSPPSDRQIASGIRAGQELLEKYQTDRRMPGVLQRIWFSGLPHVMIGSSLAYMVVRGLFSLFGVEIGI